MHHSHRRRGRDQSVPTGTAFLILVASLLLGVFLLPTTQTLAQSNISPKVQTADWPTFLFNTQRTAATTDTTFSAANASTLVKHWSFQTGGVVASSPTVVNGTVFVGSWNGYEYALNARTGKQEWATYLGVTTVRPDCNPSSGAGVSSAATVQNGVVYVGGGDAYWYALNATTGAVLWRVYTGDNSVTGGYYNWSSPLLYKGYAYIGLASFGDCPLAQGKLLRVSLTTHQVVNTFNVVPDGQIGGGIWTTPSLDTATNTIYVDTGTENNLSQPYAQAFLALDATTLALKDSWKLPEGDAVMDSDFSTSPILFNDAAGHPLVSAIDKNGYAYTFRRGHLAAGPIWKQQIATGGDCPEPCGQGSVSSGAFAQNKLFLAGEDTIINGIGYKGSVRALDPATGKIVWQHGTVGRVIGALAYANGIIVDGAGPVLEVLNAQTGNRLYNYTTGGTLFAAPSIAEGQIYVGGVDGNVYAFGLPTTTPASPPADAHCPQNWTCQDIGGATPKGSESVTKTGWTVRAGGAGIKGSTDQFRLMTQTLSQNLQITAQVTGLQGTSASTQAGLMVRQTNNPSSQYYSVMLVQGTGLVVSYRSAQGGTTTTDIQMSTATTPLYLEIQRIGDQFQAATSSNGVNYTLVPGSTATIAMPQNVLAGLAVSSGSTTATSTVTFNAIKNGAPTTSPAVTSPATPCPAGWSCQDIGNPALVGDQAVSGNTWTVQGAGTDIGNYIDQFHYVWQTIAADGVVNAHITSQANTSTLAKAGVMLRQNVTSGSVYYGAFITPNGISIQYRSPYGPDGIVALTTSGTTPLYLEVARSGSSFSTYTSSDGVNWSYLPGSIVTMNVTGSMLAGIAVTSNNPTQMGQATFDTVNVGNVAPAPPACPTGWTCGDIGYPTPAGSQSVTGGTWTIIAGGGDIWGTADAFHYIWQNLASDGSVSAQVTSQTTTTSVYAKTGVMMRQTADADSAYYLLAVTPGEGISVQYRSAQGAVALQATNIPGIVPTYLKVSRTGSSFSAYTSPDGINWTLVAGSTVTINMSGTILEGVASTSHNTAAACTSTVDSVTIS